MSSESAVAMLRSGPFRVGDWLVDPSIDEISRIDLVLKLEPRMVRLLTRLAANPGELVSTQQLLDSVWADVVVGPASVYQAISQLRKQLGDTGTTPTYIATVPRKGYRLVAPVLPVKDTPEPAPRVEAKQRRWQMPLLIVVLATGVSITAFFWTVRPADPKAAAFGESHAVITAELNKRALAVLPFAAGSPDPREVDVARTLADLLHHRLASGETITVIGSDSAAKAFARDTEPTKIGARLGSRFLVRGETRRSDSRVEVTATIVDAMSGGLLWSDSFEAPAAAIGELADDIARRVTEVLNFPVLPARARQAIDVEVYRLYLDGNSLLGSMQIKDNHQAQALFARAVTLDPGFARGHLGVGLGVLQEARLRQSWNEKSFAAAERAFARALELDPSLGEAWMGRALCAHGNAATEREFHERAIALSPNYSRVLKAYSDYLARTRQEQRALEVIDRARLIDPLNSHLHIAKKNLVNDRAEYESLLRQALDADPDTVIPLFELGAARHFMHGEFADGVRLTERAVQVDPNFTPARLQLTAMYLDLGERLAAESAVNTDISILPAVQLAMHRGDVSQAAKLARDHSEHWWFWYSKEPTLSQAVRDEALKHGKLSDALSLIAAIYEKSKDSPVSSRTSVGLIFAHTLLLAGETARGHALAREMLQAVDQPDGTPSSVQWRGRQRAAALMMLGQHEQALHELEASQKVSRFESWWYTAEFDPLYEPVRQHARFRALVAHAREHREKQRELLEQYRRAGKVPRRPGPDLEPPFGKPWFVDPQSKDGMMVPPPVTTR
jgi:DNA-binding winged helix-turn-helix (wHTH) protein/TolB-like protein